jgi:hypothetical protein
MKSEELLANYSRVFEGWNERNGTELKDRVNYALSEIHL